MSKMRRFLRLALVLLLLGLVAGTSAIVVLVWLIAPTLPSVTALREIRLQVPLSVYSIDQKLVAQFGETRRYPVGIDAVPLRVKQAFIAIEDARFYEHPGIDWRGITRALWLLATTSNRRVPGGSTITQQVARQFFLSPEYSVWRKITEIFLALKIERELGKDEILELYLNKSFFGNRAYGVAAAAEFYYGKQLDELSLEEAAMLASIPKFPSSGNPVVNPARALVRRDYVLQRMHEVGFISAEEWTSARSQSDRASPHEPPTELDAPWVAEMVRVDAIERFGDIALTDGLHVTTTLASAAQEAANLATREGLLGYDQRHGWRGAEARLSMPGQDHPDLWQAALRPYRPISGLLPALVLEVREQSVVIGMADGQTIELALPQLSWARPWLDESHRGPSPRKPADILSRGDVIRVCLDAEGDWALAQIPKAQATLVSLDQDSGAIRAMTGGFSFALNKFNRATQSQRQPGSSFKPFIYAAAFERGFTPASIVLDAPVVFNDKGAGKTWRPQNDNETFVGPMRLREAMVTSRNLVSVRILDAVGIPFARKFVQNFGFPPESLPENLSLALGTSAAPPLAMARGYAAFANGGYLIEPYFIERITDRDGNVVFEARAKRACTSCSARLSAASAGGNDGFNLGPALVPEPTPVSNTTEAPDPVAPDDLAPRAVDERTGFLVRSLLQDVVRRGTGRGAMQLGRSDLGGKTGTTNEHRDAWFSGFGGGLVTTAWMGMDDFSSLGEGEFASKTALPIWVGYMRVALDGRSEFHIPMPNGIATALIDPATGQLAAPAASNAIPEILKIEDLNRLEQRAAAQQQQPQKEEFDIF